MEQDSECGGDKLDDPWFIVWSIYIPSADWSGKSVVGYFVFLDEAPVEAIDWSSAINEGFGDDIFVESFWGQTGQYGMTLIVCLLQLHFWRFQEFSVSGESSFL